MPSGERGWPVERGRAGERGSATVEFAALLPAIALLLATLVAAAQWAVATVRAQAAVATAARVAVTDGVDAAGDSARALLGSGATVVVVREGDWFEVHVSLPAVWGLVVEVEGRSRAQS